MRIPGTFTILSIAAMVLTSCGEPDLAEQVSLVGSKWQLARIASPEGAATPDIPAKYTMSLEPDGTLALHLNCNQGTAAWSASPIDGPEGSFAISPVAMTRMACPPPSLDTRIATELQEVRSYSIGEGLLRLHLAPDEGAYVWEPFSIDDVEAN